MVFDPMVSKECVGRGWYVKEYLIGTGGWAYFRIPGLRSLTAYSRVFNFVEVNSTFYRIPALKQVESWRTLVPPDFKFAVRAHQSITHWSALQPTQTTFETFRRMGKICDALNAEILLLEMPPAFKPTETSVSEIRSLLSSVNLRRLRLSLEIRGTKPCQLPAKLLRLMQEYNIIHCTDLSRDEMPAYQSDILYTRLFGRGKHNVFEPTDVELLEIDNRAMSGKSEKIGMSFHFVRMYKDAARLKTYKQTGRFPMVTKSTGLASLEEVLAEDTRFPSTKQELVRRQGWKIFDLTNTERARAENLLRKLPKANYNDLGEVVERLRTIIE